MDTLRMDDHQLIYADAVPGTLLKLYIYGNAGYHMGGVWFRPIPKYPEEEISTATAQLLATNAIENFQEVRICDGNDFLVFHARDGVVLHPSSADAFWKQVLQVKEKTTRGK